MENNKILKQKNNNGHNNNNTNNIIQNIQNNGSLNKASAKVHMIPLQNNNSDGIRILAANI